MGDPKGGDDLELSALFEALPQALLVIDAGGQVCRANPRAVQLLGRRPPRGAPLDDHLLLHHDFLCEACCSWHFLTRHLYFHKSFSTRREDS